MEGITLAQIIPKLLSLSVFAEVCVFEAVQIVSGILTTV